MQVKHCRPLFCFKLFLQLIALIGFCSYQETANAQNFIQINEKYTCAIFANGTTSLLLNGSVPGAYSITHTKKELDALKKTRNQLRGRVKDLKALRGEIRKGTFDKGDQSFLNSLIRKYFPNDKTLRDRDKRLIATNNLILAIENEINVLNSVTKIISQCAAYEPKARRPTKYGVPWPATVRPVVIPPAAGANNREGYAGYLVTVIRNKTIRDTNGRKIGTRSGYLGCIKSRDKTTPGGIYRIFDDQPCEESEGGPNGGNTTLPFSDRTYCKNLVGNSHWGTIGHRVTVSFPQGNALQDALTNMIASLPPFYEVVIMQPIFGAPSVSLDKFKSWCSNSM